MPILYALKDEEYSYIDEIPIYTDDEIAKIRAEISAESFGVEFYAALLMPFILTGVAISANVRERGGIAIFLSSCLIFWGFGAMIASAKSRNDTRYIMNSLARALTDEEAKELLILTESRQEVKGIIAFVNNTNQKGVTYDILCNIRIALERHDSYVKKIKDQAIFNKNIKRASANINHVFKRNNNE
jgi:hypothetical protein